MITTTSPRVHDLATKDRTQLDELKTKARHDAEVPARPRIAQNSSAFSSADSSSTSPSAVTIVTGPARGIHRTQRHRCR